MKPLLIVLLLGIIGCTQYRWTRPDFDQQTWNRDLYECEKEMRQSYYLGPGVFATGLTRSSNAQEFGELCLAAKGYTKEPRP